LELTEEEHKDLKALYSKIQELKVQDKLVLRFRPSYLEAQQKKGMIPVKNTKCNIAFKTPNQVERQKLIRKQHG